ncbi:MAG: hypothetical protein JWP63_1546, partial [Candidatus Solibacter sp.]|nr:hypothetical protein [Candidatus Solibacter sp.]
ADEHAASQWIGTNLCDPFFRLEYEFDRSCQSRLVFQGINIPAFSPINLGTEHQGYRLPDRGSDNRLRGIGDLTYSYSGIFHLLLNVRYELLFDR